MRGGFGLGLGKIGRLGRPAPGKGGGLPPLPLGSKIAYLGDSNTEQALIVSSPDVAHNTDGIWTWVNLFIGGVFFEPPLSSISATAPNRGANLGKGGETLTQIAARAGDAVSLAAKIVCGLGGTNNLIALSAAADAPTTAAELATMQSATLSIWTTLRAAGIRIVWLTLPVANGTAAWSGSKETLRQAYNAWLKTQAANDLKIADIDAVLTTAHFQTNQVHTNISGAYTAGQLVGLTIVNAGWTLGSPSSLFTDATSWHTNLALVGTGGGKAGPKSTGVVPNSMVLDADTSGQGATAVGSKDTDDKPIITLGGTAASAGRIRLYNDQTSDIASVADNAQAFGDIEILSALTGVTDINVYVYIWAADYLSTGLRLSTLFSSLSEAMPLGVGRRQIWGPACPVPAGTWGRVTTWVDIDFLAGAVGGQVKIHKATGGKP